MKFWNVEIARAAQECRAWRELMMLLLERY